MGVVLVLVFLVVPLAELFVLLQVGGAIGALNTIGLLLVMGVLGGWLLKREGIGVARRISAAASAGQVPGRELLDAFLILLGGAFLLTPGFLTDVIGFALLVPPVRAVVRPALARAATTYAYRRGHGRVIDIR